MAILIYIAALVLAVVDLFVPSAGMLIILAALGGVASVLLGFRSGNTAGMAMLTLVMATIPVFGYLALKIWPHTPIGRRVILKPPLSATADQTAAEVEPLHAYIGHVMLAETAFLPTGHLRVGHRRLNAVAESGIIEAGEHVQIVALRERNLVVRVTQEPLSRLSTTVTPGQSAEDPTIKNYLDLPADELGLESLDN
jgi:membrane-bound ClpP family serine protease